MQTDPLFSTDAYARRCEARVVAADPAGQRVALDRTVFYPGGGGQPHDTGVLTWGEGSGEVVKAYREGRLVWHCLATEDIPDPGQYVFAELDWEMRHALMRTHTALHVLCGVIWHDFQVPVTGGNMEPGRGRLDFPLETASTDLGHRIEQRINDEIDRAHHVRVEFVDRSEAGRDPALIRTKADLVPAAINPLRVIDIVGLDKQADGGTHVSSTREVGRVEVTKTESKGRSNKRIRLALHNDPPTSQGRR